MYLVRYIVNDYLRNPVKVLIIDLPAMSILRHHQSSLVEFRIIEYYDSG